MIAFNKLLDMCYYNGIRIKNTANIRLKNIEKAISDQHLPFYPLVSGFDYGKSPVLKKTETKIDFDIIQMEWGFLPSYIKTREGAMKFRLGYKKDNGQFQPPIITLNAVGEELLLPKKIYRDAALNRRCLVLSTGFYEWRHVFPLNKRTGLPVKTAVKYPYRILIKGKEYFFLAAIWNPWNDRESGEYAETFSIVTTAANPLMEQVHNSRKRMPVILPEDLAWEWLMGEPDENRITEIATFQFPATEMEAYTLAKDFREAVDPELPFHYPDLPALII